MMPGRVPCVPENLLGLSWHDSALIPMLNPSNVMDYFSERSNPFYDRTCNNEVVKMQRLSLDQLTNMTGLEYQLLHVQEPILYVIRKQHRHSPTQATPLANYYIIAGVVYQAPDLASVINSRILCCLSHLQSGLEEAQSNARYHPSKGYWWSTDTGSPGKGQGTREEPSSLFQRLRVDMLLGELTKRYPLPPPPHVGGGVGGGGLASAGASNQLSSATASSDVKPTTTSTATAPSSASTVSTANIKKEPPDVEVKTEPREIKTEKLDSPSMKPPPEKKPRIN